MGELEENKDGHEHRRRQRVLTVDGEAHLVNTVVLVLLVYLQSSEFTFKQAGKKTSPEELF